jgi:hypothetical protein
MAVYGSAMKSRSRVELDMKPSVLRDLLRTDLEFAGFDVRVASAKGADVLITDGVMRRRGHTLTVRLGDEICVQGPTGTWWFPTTGIGSLADILRAELRRLREEAA